MPGRFSFSTRNAVSLPSVRPIAPSTILSTVREGILANGRERVKRRNPANLLHWIAFFERVRMRTNVVLAEPEGFEPSVRLYIVQRFSKPPPSATRPQLRRGRPDNRPAPRGHSCPRNRRASSPGLLGAICSFRPGRTGCFGGFCSESPAGLPF